MFVTNHVLLGALIAQEVPLQPVFVWLIAFLSHFLIDVIPHGDTDLYRGYINGKNRRFAVTATIVDAVVATGLTIFLVIQVSAEHRLLTLVAILISALPDILVGIQELWRSRLLNWFHRLHFFFHGLISRHTGDFRPLIGMGLEFAVIAMIVLNLRAFYA